MRGIEPPSPTWKEGVMAIIRHLLFVGVEGLEPSNSNESGFTVRSDCRYTILPVVEDDRFELPTLWM